MAMRFLGLCRGDGKGYVKIGTDTKPELLMATIGMPDGSCRQCPIFPIGFPGEEVAARTVWGDASTKESYEAVVVVPLLDNADLSISVTNRENDTVLGTIPFKPLTTKVRSRLTYKHRPQFAAQIRDIDQRRLSGTPHVYVTGIYPVDEQHYSCRFTVRYPLFQEKK